MRIFPYNRGTVYLVRETQEEMPVVARGNALGRTGGMAYGSGGTRWHLLWDPHGDAPLGGVPSAASPGPPTPGALGGQPGPDAPEYGPGAGNGRRGRLHCGGLRGGPGGGAAPLAPTARLGRRRRDPRGARFRPVPPARAVPCRARAVAA